MASIALVVGSGRCLYDDVRALGSLAQNADVFAINNLVELYAYPVHHGVSHHPAKLTRWHGNRIDPKRKGDPANIVLHASSRHSGCREWPQFHAGGSSSLLAVRVALALGHTQVVIAGVPLDASGYLWSDPAQVAPYDFSRYRAAWVNAKADLQGRVTAASGYLAELLGSAIAAQVAA